jgi:hypothetical protein
MNMVDTWANYAFAKLKESFSEDGKSKEFDDMIFSLEKKMSNIHPDLPAELLKASALMWIDLMYQTKSEKVTYMNLSMTGNLKLNVYYVTSFRET